ncbi:PIN domain-containing protein [Peptoclostridium litorale]|uniref:PIN domain-containing protein n=1 Tax=Peptoclostridium litorale TaxID=1557 RepID=UPI0013565B3F|nr:PIN domain-containing protein [Peptoclostridium litorale]
MIRNEKVFVDTNVLIWTHYSKASISESVKAYQMEKYPDAIETLIENNNTLVTTTLNISELMRVIEKHEINIAKANDINLKDKYDKEIRNIKSVREEIKKEVELAMNQIKSIYNCVEISIKNCGLDDFIKKYLGVNLDVNDFMMIEEMTKNEIKWFLSDDSDFTSYPDSTKYLLTANHRALPQN